METIQSLPRKPRLKKRVAAVLPAIALLCFWGCDDHDEEDPSVRIESPANGSTVRGPYVLLRVSTTRFSYAGQAAGKVSAAQHGGEGVEGGHIHVFLDRPVGLDADAVTDLSKADTTTLTITQPGEHYIIVAGADEDHRAVKGMIDSVKFTVTLPE